MLLALNGVIKLEVTCAAIAERKIKKATCSQERATLCARGSQPRPMQMEPMVDSKRVHVITGAVLVDNQRFDLQGGTLCTVGEACRFLEAQACFASLRVRNK